jgi:hypothetical protein
LNLTSKINAEEKVSYPEEVTEGAKQNQGRREKRS